MLRASAFSLSSVNPLARNGLGEVVKHFAVSGASRSMDLPSKWSRAASTSSSRPCLRSAACSSTMGIRQSHDSAALALVLMFWRSASNATAKLVKGRKDVTNALIVARFFDPR